MALSGGLFLSGPAVRNKNQVPYVLRLSKSGLPGRVPSAGGKGRVATEQRLRGLRGGLGECVEQSCYTPCRLASQVRCKIAHNHFRLILMLECVSERKMAILCDNHALIEVEESPEPLGDWRFCAASVQMVIYCAG